MSIKQKTNINKQKKNKEKCHSPIKISRTNKLIETPSSK